MSFELFFMCKILHNLSCYDYRNIPTVNHNKKLLASSFKLQVLIHKFIIDVNNYFIFDIF